MMYEKFIYIYIYTHTHTHTYIYIYIYIDIYRYCRSKVDSFVIFPSKLLHDYYVHWRHILIIVYKYFNPLKITNSYYNRLICLSF